MAGKKHYALIMLGGVVGGIFLYHVLGKHIESIWGKVPGLKNVHSNFAVSNFGSEI